MPAGKYKTNHSLRATGATSLYQKGVPEKLIQERTGHRSIEALRVYEHTNNSQHQAVSNLLSGQPPSHSTSLYNTSSVHSQSLISASSHISASNLQQFPGIQFQGSLHGCTININTPQHQKCNCTSDKEIDELFSLIQDYV